MERKIGLIVNPIAGMGGRVGFKGTDGWNIVEKAMKLGAKPWSQDRATRALKKLSPLKDEIELITYPGDMGENVVFKCGFKPKVIGRLNSERTTSEDTKQAAKEMLKLGVDLILFVGGDGTARDIYDAIDLNGVVIGIPAGVKMYSAVFASSPEAAGKLAVKYLKGEIRDTVEREVMDIDEEKFRQGVFAVRLYGYLRIPFNKKYIVGGKSPTSINERLNQEAIAVEVIENMEDDCYYIIGPGTTTKMILKKLNCDYSLLGVDIVYRGELVGKDLNESQILEIIKDKQAKIVVSPIGGQGYVFGRGNQQISPKVIREVGGKPNVIIVATQQKIIPLRGRPLLVDTNDKKLDEDLSGWYKVVIGYKESLMYKVVPG
ncbi:ATP-NAD kinase family protein [Thermococcus sibiricus]|uniref:ATP-NAD/AcoX kinase n=1 Tax=Thermococcus sibiricus TaxID=172049 RepID=A0A101EMT0_9EURY|nr:ATP-NAD kinase family protein [Thermococcus sibiricus]KUK18034.1 MAG: ATP-NAD/AcoX kinase [Thermococcus sibiricus]